MDFFAEASARAPLVASNAHAASMSSSHGVVRGSPSKSSTTARTTASLTTSRLKSSPIMRATPTMRPLTRADCDSCSNRSATALKPWRATTHASKSSCNAPKSIFLNVVVFADDAVSSSPSASTAYAGTTALSFAANSPYALACRSSAHARSTSMDTNAFPTCASLSAHSLNCATILSILSAETLFKTDLMTRLDLSASNGPRSTPTALADFSLASFTVSSVVTVTGVRLPSTVVPTFSPLDSSIGFGFV